jgi:hypothetical protein
MKSAIFGLAKPERRAPSSSGLVGWIGPSLREGVGDLGGVFGHHDGAGVDAGAAAVVADRAGDDVDEVAPVLDAILADENLLQPGPWIWMAGLLAYCWVVDLSPKISARPQVLRMVPRRRGRWDRSRTPRPARRRR